MGERVGKREKDRSNEGSNNNDCRTEYGQMLNTTALFLSRSLFISPACDRFAHFTYGNNAIFSPRKTFCRSWKSGSHFRSQCLTVVRTLFVCVCDYAFLNFPPNIKLGTLDIFLHACNCSVFFYPLSQAHGWVGGCLLLQLPLPFFGASP